MLLTIKSLTYSKKQKKPFECLPTALSLSLKPLVMGLFPTSLLTMFIPQPFWMKVPSVARVHYASHLQTFAYSSLPLWNILPPILCLANPYSYFMSPLRHHFSEKSFPILTPLLVLSFLPMLPGSLYFPYYSSIKDIFFSPHLDCKSIRMGTMSLSFTSNSLCLVAESQHSQTQMPNKHLLNKHGWMVILSYIPSFRMPRNIIQHAYTPGLGCVSGSSLLFYG